MRDKLFLLENEFTDAELPGRLFYCRDCITLNGLIEAFPDPASKLDIVRLKHPRPRATVATLIGDANQRLPVLVLSEDAPAELATGEHEGTRFVNDLPQLLHALHVRHGFPEAHP